MKISLALLALLAPALALADDSSVSYPCFETMARIYANAQALPDTLTGKEKAAVEAARWDALKRSGDQKANEGLVAKGVVGAQGGLSGIKVEVGTDPEYSDYYLYKFDGERLQLLSKHFGDDQGPEIHVVCKGWSIGQDIPL
jgi:hypothetical protein